MIHARYVGPRSDLLGHSALLQTADCEGQVLALFDTAPDQTLCYHWHTFPAEHFTATADQHEVTPL